MVHKLEVAARKVVDVVDDGLVHFREELVPVMAGRESTLSTTAVVTSMPIPLDAVTVTLVDPSAVGVPERVAEPSPLSVKLSPAGKLALEQVTLETVQEYVATGEPLVSKLRVAGALCVRATSESGTLVNLARAPTAKARL